MAAIIAARALSIFFFFETENSEIRDHAIFYFSLEMMHEKERRRRRGDIQIKSKSEAGDPIGLIPI